MLLASGGAALITGTTTQIARRVQALTALLQLITAAVMAAGLLVGLLLIDWPKALGAGAAAAGAAGGAAGAGSGDPPRRAHLPDWQHRQWSTYLADSSIVEKIAFGVARQKIVLARVRQAVAQAQVASFIEASPESRGSFVVERSIRLSGDQRQQIGIARALYKQAHVLVFGEATSALDSSTEEAAMAAVEGLSK